MCPPWEPLTNNSPLDHSSIASFISFWLIVSQQLFKTCFRWSMSLIFCRYASCEEHAKSTGFSIRWVRWPVRGFSEVANICLQQSIFTCQRCNVYKQVTSLMTHIHYPIPAVYQRIFNPAKNILRWLADGAFAENFGANRLILRRTVAK